MYDFDWHGEHGEKTASSATRIIELLASFLDLSSVLDVGCGDGQWLSVCRARGAETIHGVDGPWTQQSRLLIPREDFTIHDLSTPLDLQRRFSLAICLEVAEHVPAPSSQVFVDNLVRHSDVVLFGAAIPYQGGFRHINEQWQSRWATLFGARGFTYFDPIRERIWQDVNVHFWYKQNVLLYVNKANSNAMERVMRFLAANAIQQLPLDIVHPERFEALASYKQIAFRALIRELPRQTSRKLKNVILRKL